MIGLNLDGHTVEATTVRLVRYLYLRNILSMKLCPILSPNGLYCPETLADKAAHLPTPDRLLDFAQGKVVGAFTYRSGKTILFQTLVSNVTRIVGLPHAVSASTIRSHDPYRAKMGNKICELGDSAITDSIRLNPLGNHKRASRQYRLEIGGCN